MNRQKNNFFIFKIKIKMELSKEIQNKILIELADKCMCYVYMHTKTHRLFYNIHLTTSILSILISTFGGCALFSYSNLSEKDLNNLIITIGIFMFLDALLKILQTSFEFEKISDSHKNMGDNYSILHNKLKLNLLNKNCENKVFDNLTNEFLNIEKKALFIPKIVINSLNHIISEKYPNIVRPNICGIFGSTTDYSETILYVKKQTIILPGENLLKEVILQEEPKEGV